MNEDSNAAEVVEPVTPAENGDTPTEDVKAEGKPDANAEDKTKATPEVEPTEAEKALAKAEKKAAKVSYENRKLTRQLKQSAEQTAKEIAELKSLILKNSPQAKAPDIADFERLEDFLEARDNYREAQAQAKAEPAPEQGDAEYQQYFMESRTEMIENGNDKYDDFELVVTDDATKLSLPMCEALFEMDADVQADVAYFLGKNHKETLRIAKLNPGRQFAELGKLEAKFTSKPAKKRTSNAPEPISPVGGASTPSDTIQPTMDIKDYKRIRDKQRGRT